MQSLGGIVDVCRVVVTLHHLMGLEFSLLNQMNSKFGVRKAKRVGLFAHTKVTVTCEWLAGHCHSNLTHFIKVIMTWTIWFFTVIALVGIKLYLVKADSCNQVAWQCSHSYQKATSDQMLVPVSRNVNMVSSWSCIPGKWFIAWVSRESCVIAALMVMDVLKPVSPYLLLGNSHGQRGDHKIGNSCIWMILGIHTWLIGLL